MGRLQLVIFEERVCIIPRRSALKETDGFTYSQSHVPRPNGPHRTEYLFLAYDPLGQ